MLLTPGLLTPGLLSTIYSDAKELSLEEMKAKWLPEVDGYTDKVLVFFESGKCAGKRIRSMELVTTDEYAAARKYNGLIEFDGHISTWDQICYWVETDPYGIRECLEENVFCRTNIIWHILHSDADFLGVLVCNVVNEVE